MLSQLHFCTMAEDITQRVRALVSRLAAERLLTPEFIRSEFSTVGSAEWSQKQLLKAMIKAVLNVRARGQIGRLRAAILAGATMLGPAFTTALERSGALLADDMPRTKFGNFLANLQEELDTSTHHDWSVLGRRLDTYRAYQQLTESILQDANQAERLLRVRPRLVIKKILALADLMFLRSHFGFEAPTEPRDWLDRLGASEDVASVASILVAQANEFHPLDSWDLASSAIGELATDEMRALMRYGKGLMHRHEIAKDISLFGYSLESIESGAERVFYLHPPSLAFEYAMKLGFIRSEMSWAKIPSDVSGQGSIPLFSLKAAAELFAKKLHEVLHQVKDDGTPFRRVRVNFPMDPDLYRTVMNSFLYDDLVYRERLNQDYLFLLRSEEESELQLTDKLDLPTFQRIWRHLQFMSLVDIAILRPYDRQDSTILFNSLVRVLTEQNMVGLITSMGVTEEQAREFIGLVSADVHRLGYLDLQYRPFLRIAVTRIPKKGIVTPPEVVYVPALLCISNVLRNVQSANKLRLKANANAFVDVVANVLREIFPKVTTNRQVEVGNQKTDIDVAVLQGGVLYIFECKHSVPPTSSHEMRDLWEEIETGTRQLGVAMKALSESSRLLSYLAGWFPGTNRQDIVNIVIKPCVLCSHRIFSGMAYAGIPIRDVASLSKLAGDGIIGLGHADKQGESIMYRFRVTPESGFSASDLDDYLSAESKYFKMFVPFMHLLSRFERLGNITVARETYAYEVDSDEWVSHMESLGFARQADEHKTLTFPWSSEEVLEKLAKKHRESPNQATDSSA